MEWHLWVYETGPKEAARISPSFPSMVYHGQGVGLTLTRRTRRRAKNKQTKKRVSLCSPNQNERELGPGSWLSSVNLKSREPTGRRENENDARKYCGKEGHPEMHCLGANAETLGSKTACDRRRSLSAAPSSSDSEKPG